MMSPNLATVLAAAESLLVGERYELIELLLQGLDDVATSAAEGRTPALSEAWRQEIARRSAEYDGGQAETVSWQEIKTRLMARDSTWQWIDISPFNVAAAEAIPAVVIRTFSGKATAKF